MTDILKPDNNQLKLIADLAKESEVTDPIDWSELNISEDEAYLMMAAHVTEMDLSDETVTKSIITKMLVENFVLNLKLLGKK